MDFESGWNAAVCESAREKCATPADLRALPRAQGLNS